ncbi:MAG: hypothetical protein WCX08_03025, partial [Candidatus Buchananbacteria bacterium]
STRVKRGEPASTRVKRGEPASTRVKRGEPASTRVKRGEPASPNRGEQNLFCSFSGQHKCWFPPDGAAWESEICYEA